MDRKILLSLFGLITVSWAQEPLVVSQPSSAESTEGGSVTLHCSYLSTSKPTVGSYWWVKDLGLEVKSSTPEFKGRVNRTSDQGFLLERRADIEIRNLRPSDSGTYRCVVKIPGFQETPGKGTKLKVLKTTSHAQQPLVVSQPTSAEGTKGGSITLRCSYNSSSKIKVGSFRWVKDSGLEVRNTAKEFMGRVSFTSEQGFLLERRADIEIWNLSCNDSGLYHCLVRFPGFQETSGNGTELRISEETAPETAGNGTHSHLGLLIPLAAGLASATVTICLIFLYCSKRQGMQEEHIWRQTAGTSTRQRSHCPASDPQTEAPTPRTGYQERAPKKECRSQDHEAEAILNYAELITTMGSNARSQCEMAV